MQWRMLARRGRAASWTVVGDAAQASWSDLAEAGRARDEAFSGQERRAFHMDTNYRNAREIFDYARDVILPLVPDADIPDAVRETGVDPVDRVVEGSVAAAAADAVDQLLGEVEGSIAVIAGAALGRAAGRARRGRRRAGAGHRPAVDQGPGVGRDGGRRPAGHRRGVARRGAGALRRADPRGAPDARAAPRLSGRCALAGSGPSGRVDTAGRRCGLARPREQSADRPNRPANISVSPMTSTDRGALGALDRGGEGDDRDRDLGQAPSPRRVSAIPRGRNRARTEPTTRTARTAR